MPPPKADEVRRWGVAILWYHAIHDVTGDMALKGLKHTPELRTIWVQRLRAVADEMEKHNA